MRAAIACALVATAQGASPGAEALEAVRGLELDPTRCYRVRDIFFEREDVKLYFTDGHLIFAKPVLGRTLAAMFVATSPTDVGEVLVIPPTAAERQSAARFLGETILNEKFRNAMMFFTDDTPEVLGAAIVDSPASALDPEQGQRIASRWGVLLRTLLDGSAPRVILDLYSGRALSSGFFVAAIRGSKHGRFDLIVDGTLPEQVAAGQQATADGRAIYEVWLRFRSRSVRDGRASQARDPAILKDYRIDTVFGEDLEMQVSADATLELTEPGSRAIGFEISERLEIEAVSIAGEPAEFVQQRRPVPRQQRSANDSLVVVMLPPAVTAPAEYPIRFEYRGRVVSDAGSGVFFVGDRGDWYPRIGLGRASFDLSFRYPRHLELVATGERVEDGTADGMRQSRFVSGKPIRLAGFNLGTYASASRRVEGFRIEVRATRTVEDRLRPAPRPIWIPLPQVSGRRRDRARPPMLVFPSVPVVSPAVGIERIADESADAFRYFLRNFGEPAMPTTVISPVPGGFGQGFPGLVYASTLSYFEKGDQLLKNLSPDEQRFFSDLMRPHEIAHQWWGNVVSSEMDSDGWIMEGLATYSSVMWVEHRNGTEDRDRILAGFRDNLLRKVDGGTLEGAGPVVLGRRLRTSKMPDAYRVIVYEKGAWIMHMLRGILGDEAFMAMLRSLREGHAGEAITTEGFRLAAARFVPEDHPDPELLDFFDQWVHASGIPRLAVSWDQTQEGPRHRFKMRLEQSGVPDYFPQQVPVEVRTLPGRSLVKTMAVGDGEDYAEESIVLRNAATEVVIDPQGWLLADIR